MPRPALFAAVALACAGCHRVCGEQWVPIWVAADCAVDTEPDSGPGCEVELALTANGSDEATVAVGGTVTLEATATNVTGGDVVITMTEQCPSDQALFTGLPDYDYYSTCMDGVCEDTGEVYAETLAPGASITVMTTLDLGASTCNEPVPAGIYDLSFALATTGDPQPMFCGPAPVALFVE